MQDVGGLFDHRPADVQWEEKDTEGNRVKVKAWDEEGFESWVQVNEPVRMVKMVRKRKKQQLREAKKKSEVEILERWVVTTCPKPAVLTETISKIAAARWDIENNGFHDLKTYWHLDHPYVHELTAVEAWVSILLLAVNMVYSLLLHVFTPFSGLEGATQGNHSRN